MVASRLCVPRGSTLARSQPALSRALSRQWAWKQRLSGSQPGGRTFCNAQTKKHPKHPRLFPLWVRTCAGSSPFLSKEIDVLLRSMAASRYPTVPSRVSRRSHSTAPAAWACENLARAYKAHKKKPAATLSGGSSSREPAAMDSNLRT